MRTRSAISSVVRSVECEQAERLCDPGSTLIQGTLMSITSEGLLMVANGRGEVVACEFLQSSGVRLQAGDQVLVAPALTAGMQPTVLGRIGRYSEPAPASQVMIEATESLTLKCGEASIDLRADGKVMVRGEDVLLRAKGTQRIRGGTVSIN